MELEVGLSGWTLTEEELWGEEIYATRKVEGVQRLISQGEVRLPNDEVCPMRSLLYQCVRHRMQNVWLVGNTSVQVENMSYDRRDFGEGTPLPKNDLRRFKTPRLYQYNNFLSCLGYHYDDEYWERD